MERQHRVHPGALGNLFDALAQATKRLEDKDQDLECDSVFCGSQARARCAGEGLAVAWVAKEMRCSVLYQLKFPKHAFLARYIRLLD